MAPRVDNRTIELCAGGRRVAVLHEAEAREVLACLQERPDFIGSLGLARKLEAALATGDFDAPLEVTNVQAVALRAALGVRAARRGG
ncbi:MAG TPA: hypothetical protein VHC67_08790 [Gaiellaceae bacterium]|jgi:hypothetical protein|nr:hypothetical protein [Gaiellaceae bacterium]